METLSKIGLGGGCHWCTEGVFVHLRGVERVEQGWISSSDPAAAAFSEAVIVYYDPVVVSLQQLIEVHLQTHAATVKHGLRHRYRSAVYYFDTAERADVVATLTTVASQYREEVITQALPFGEFKPSLLEHQDYYRSDPERPFCVRYIQPKLDSLDPELLHASG